MAKRSKSLAFSLGAERARPSSPFAADVMPLVIKSRDLLSVLCSVLLLILAFPAFDCAFLAWIALVPLLIALQEKTLRPAFFLSLLTGTGFWMGHCYWVNVVPGVTWTDFTLCGLYLGSYVGLFAVVVGFVSRHTRLPLLLTTPAVWVAVEYLRAHAGFLGVPWALLGHSQYRNLSLIQLASLTGVYGISFVIVMVNVTVSECILAWAVGSPQPPAPHRLTPWQSGTITGAVLALSLIYGIQALAQSSGGETVSVTVVQGNIAQELKWKLEMQKLNLDTYVRLTHEARQQSQTSLMVWPETAVQGFLPQDLYVLSTFARLVHGINVPVLVGGSQRPTSGPKEWRTTHRLNSAFLIAPLRGIVRSYSKMHLLPFGEYLPYQDVLPWPARFTSIPDIANFLPGEDYTLFDLEGHRFGVLICWESLFPELARQFVNQGAEFLINMTNEAWFAETAAPYQFLMMNVFRAVENRVSVVRSANTGISGFIDPYGRILGKVEKDTKDIFVAGHLTKEIGLLHRSTLYTQYGDLWAYLNVSGTVFLLGAAFLKGRLGEGNVALKR
jgi:apolipoprotein N-acyltransferase